MYSFWYGAPILLPTGDKVEMNSIYLKLLNGRHKYRCIVQYQKLYIQSKVLLRMGEFVARNMYS